MNINEKLKLLNIKIPTAQPALGSYVPFKVVNKLVYISGQLPIKEDGTIIKGKVGELLSIEDGQQAAEFSCINILSQLKAACNGDLNIVNNCLKISGFVNSTSKFIDQPKIINPASELIVKIFGDKGKHTRIAVSVNSLPLDACVEIDAIFEIN